MSDKFRNIIIALSFLIVSITYSFTTLTANTRVNRSIEKEKNFDSASEICLKEEANRSYEQDWSQCMRYRGFPVGYKK